MGAAAPLLVLKPEEGVVFCCVPWVGLEVDWASWFMEGPEEVVVGLDLDEDIRLSRSMSTPSELHVVCLLSSFWKTEKNNAA